MGDRTRNIVIGVVTSVWAVNFAAGLIPALAYKPDQAINGIFMTIVGGLFALGAKKGSDKGDPPSGGSHSAAQAPASAGEVSAGAPSKSEGGVRRWLRFCTVDTGYVIS